MVTSATPREFMERVVDWPGPENPGFINLHWTSPKGPGLRGKPFKELHEFMNMAQWAATKPADYKEIYFCTSLQSATGKMIYNSPVAARTKQCALNLKAIWLDVDVKEKGYASLNEALDALITFTTNAHLPTPSAVIFSGGGVQVYWISKTSLTPAEWRPYAEGLKAEALRLGLKCDAGLTTDEARVLRVPGTFNNKQVPPRPVRVAHLGRNYDFISDLKHLGTIGLGAATKVTASTVTNTATVTASPMPAFASGKMAAAFQTAGLDPQESLSAGINQRSDLPLNPDAIFKVCTHYRDAAQTHGKSHSEPLWNLTLLGATWFEGGRGWAHYFSKGYPTYSKGETDAKYDDKLTRVAGGTGWPSCQAFESAGAKCKTCPYYGKLRSPLNLAERVQTYQNPVHVAPPPPDNLMLPEGYTVEPSSSVICKIVQKTSPEGVTEEHLAPLFMCKLRCPILQRGTRKFLFETSLDGGTWGQVSLFEIDLATEQTLVKALRTFGVKPFPDNQRALVQFMTSWTAKLDAAKKRINTVSFGWLRKEDGGEEPIGFAYGGKVVMADGTEQAAGFSDAQVEQSYTPRGSEEPWRKLHKIITDQNHPPIEAIAATGFAAPLMRSTKIYNGVFCAYSNGSGAHKSTSIASGAAIWGSPVMTKERPISSQKGILRKMGHVRNLPVYWDEISEAEHMDEVREVVSYLTEGSEGTKLRQNRELFDKEAWQTLMLVGSNQSLCENIQRNVQSTDAKLERVFEFIVPKRPDSVDPNDVADLVMALDYNYGKIGLLYSAMLGRDPAGIDAYVKGIHKKFNHEVDHVSVERFRSAMAAATFAGAGLANQIGCTFHLQELWDFLKEQYFTQRDMIKSAQTVGGSPENTVSMFTQFIKGCVQGNNILTVQTLPAARRGHPSAIAFIAGPTKDRPAPIHVRCSQTDRVIEISRKKLELWLTANKATSGSVISGLKKHYSAYEVQKVDLAAGAGVQGGRETIIRLPVPAGSPFEGMLFTHAPIDQRPLATSNDGESEGEGDLLTAAVNQAASDLALVQSQPVPPLPTQILPKSQ